jgi:hypothetical protein
MAKILESLNYKRNVNYFTEGNPERSYPHVLNTIGIGKAVLNATVPNVVGLSFSAAQSAITSANLAMDSFGDTSQVAASQSPAANTVVAQHSSVNVLFGQWPELVVNGTFNTDLSSWSNNSQAPSQVIWNAATAAMFRGLDDTSFASLNQLVNIVPLSMGKKFRASFSISSLNTGAGYDGRFYVGTISNPTKYFNQEINNQGLFEVIFIPDYLDIVISAYLKGNGSSFLLDNVSLKRIDY